jgi:cell division topological specificity factor
MGWLRKLVDLLDPPAATIASADSAVIAAGDLHSARSDAKNRLRLVLMHDRTQLSPAMLEQMRDDMVEVISKYVEIDKEALEVNLESDESNTIALVANIPVLRTRTSLAGG